MTHDPRFTAFANRMQQAGLPSLAVEAFGQNYDRLVGDTGIIRETDIVPIPQLPHLDTLTPYAEAGARALRTTCLIKLNGGLGTSMGLERAKSLLPVKGQHSFLDILAMQVQAARARFDVELPLLTMNSFVTDADTLQAFRTWPDLEALSFLQHRAPKVLQATLAPAPESAGDDAWCPCGHGDLYAALQTSGVLQQLLDRGIEYLFVSNSDNLGAVLDVRIVGYLATEHVPFLAEQTLRTAADRKGGHLAMRADGRLLLRERSQCAAEDEAAFEDVQRHRYFNTNNLWMHLPSVQAVLDQSQGVMPLPLIRNQKTLDPRDPASPPVYQLETAMGAAIENFEGARALEVPRSRFAPVKTTNDLLLLWSDAYELTEDGQLLPTGPNALPLVTLDDRYYKFIDQLQERFPQAPSLRRCQRLGVEGDVHWGRNIQVHGQVSIVNRRSEPLFLPDGTVLDADLVAG